MTDMRYLITFDDGGAGMRARREPLTAGDTIEDGGAKYVVTTVEPPPSNAGFGRAWAVRLPSPSEG
jgi:hypothetical protein